MRTATALPAAAALLLWGAAAAAAQSDDASILRAFEKRITTATEKAATVAVSIKVDRIKDTAKKPPPGNAFMNGGVFAVRPQAPVSGVILESDGWIATTYFNVEGDLRGIEVTLPDGTVHEAELKGWHIHADIALLKIKATGLPTLPKADAAELKTGDFVVAVGRAPDGRGVTSNPGILSAAGRHAGRSIQVDSRLNFGNVGGPLVDLDGRLVGMTCKVTMINAGDRGQNSGVSFALLEPKIAEFMPDLKEGKRVQGGGGKPFMGIGPDGTYEGKEGVRIGNVVEGGSAKKAGVENGDIILSIDGVKTNTFEDLRGEILKRKIGDQLKVRLRRGTEELEIELALGENPGD